MSVCTSHIVSTKKYTSQLKSNKCITGTELWNNKTKCKANGHRTQSISNKIQPSCLNGTMH